MMTTGKPREFFGRTIRHLHCVGVGGMGMAPLAIYLAQSGCTVTGEDAALTEEVRRVLTAGGVRLAALPDTAEIVVCSSAVGAGHPTRQAAAGRGLQVVRRGEMLAETLRGRRVVAVCGSHGKTTTTAMLAHALQQADFPAGYVLGGLFADATMPPARPGTNDWVVAEIDESDGTIGGFAPEITVLVNFDWDHPDFYRDPDELERTFAALCARTSGPVLVNATCARSRVLAPRALTFGPGGDFALEQSNQTETGLALTLGGKFGLKTARVNAFGDFNALNATAALAAATLMGATPNPALLGNFPGVRRRQAVLHATAGLTVLEDYAHHPAEVRALLTGLRGRMAGAGRLLVVFQPHRYSRTARFKADFAQALATADRVFLHEVYAAGENPVPGGSAQDILAECRQHAPALPVTFPADAAALGRELDAAVQAGDWVAFVGAGDIDRLARRWLKARLQRQPDDWAACAVALRQRLGPETKLLVEESLAAKTTMRVGGAARLYAEPATEADLQALLRGARELGVEVFMLGRGSNLIVPDEGVEGLVVSLAHANWAAFELRADGRVWAGAGLRLKNLCGLAAKTGLTGFEFLEGIPGCVGGALRMNAGAMGGWMFDVVEEVRLMTRDGEVHTLPKTAMHVDYRHCAELETAIALGALLRPAAAAAAEAVNRQIDVYRRKRHESQPREPSAGCIFKNPPGDSAGRLIDASGLKGERVGDAEVSAVHANFIINRGRATAGDVLGLVRRIRARVQEQQGVDLQPEVMLYGKDWREVL